MAPYPVSVGVGDAVGGVTGPDGGAGAGAGGVTITSTICVTSGAVVGPHRQRASIAWLILLNLRSSAISEIDFGRVFPPQL